MGLEISNLSVANYMTPYPISVDPDVSFTKAVNFMAERGFGNLIISEGVIPLGILTEQEIISAIALPPSIPGYQTSKIVGAFSIHSSIDIGLALFRITKGNLQLRYVHS